MYSSNTFSKGSFGQASHPDDWIYDSQMPLLSQKNTWWGPFLSEMDPNLGNRLLHPLIFGLFRHSPQLSLLKKKNNPSDLTAVGGTW